MRAASMSRYIDDKSIYLNINLKNRMKTEFVTQKAKK